MARKLSSSLAGNLQLYLRNLISLPASRNLLISCLIRNILCKLIRLKSLLTVHPPRFNIVSTLAPFPILVKQYCLWVKYFAYLNTTSTFFKSFAAYYVAISCSYVPLIIRGEWPSGPASSISLTELRHGCVRSETGWVTFQINDEIAHSPVLRKGCYTKGPMPGCGMYIRPKLAEKDTMSVKSLGILPVIYAADELQNTLPRKTMLFEGDANSAGERNDVSPNS